MFEMTPFRGLINVVAIYHPKFFFILLDTTHCGNDDLQGCPSLSYSFCFVRSTAIVWKDQELNMNTYLQVITSHFLDTLFLEVDYPQIVMNIDLKTCYILISCSNCKTIYNVNSKAKKHKENCFVSL